MNCVSSTKKARLTSSPRHGRCKYQTSVALHSNPTSRDDFVAPIPEAERHDIMLAYHAQLNSADDETRLKAARAWTRWEYVLLLLPLSCGINLSSERMFTSKLHVDPAHVAQAEKDDYAK